MDKNEILVQLQDVFREVLDDDSIVLTMETTSDDIEAWNSLSHIQLVYAIQDHFGMRCKSNEILLWKSAAEIVKQLSKK